MIKRHFQFACELEPIDRFSGCMSKQDLLENLLRQDAQAGFLMPEKRTEKLLRVMRLEQEAEQRTCEISRGEFPIRVLFFSVPPIDGKSCQICALTQIESGRCYLLTPDCTPILIYVLQGRKLYCL